MKEFCEFFSTVLRVVLVSQVISVHFQKALQQCTDSVTHFEEEHLKEICKQISHRFAVAATWRSGEQGVDTKLVKNNAKKDHDIVNETNSNECQRV